MKVKTDSAVKSKHNKVKLLSKPAKVLKGKVGRRNKLFGVDKHTIIKGLVSTPSSSIKSLSLKLGNQIKTPPNIKGKYSKEYEHRRSPKPGAACNVSSQTVKTKCNKLSSNRKATMEKDKRRVKNDKGEVGTPHHTKVHLDSNKVSAAVSSLLTVLNSRSKKEVTMLDLPESVYMQVECIKIPICQTKQLRFKIPHPSVNETSDILLITPDKKGAKIYPEKAVEHYAELLAKHDINFIQKVMPIRMLKEEYFQYEMRRKLVDQFDLILVDASVSKCLPKILGRNICYKNKMPMVVHLGRKDLKVHIKAAFNKTHMTVKSNGHTSITKVGDTKMSEEEITANISAVCAGLAECYPGGWQNIRSLSIKGATSVSLPIYLSLVSPNNVKTPVEKRNKEESVEGELSTIPGMNVIVSPDGTVTLKKVEEHQPSDDDNDDDILLEAKKYIQSSKTVRYDDDSDTDKEGDAITASVEQDFLNNYKNSIDKQEDEEEDEDNEEHESSDDDDPPELIPISGKKRKLVEKGKSSGESTNNKKQKKTKIQGKTKGQNENTEAGTKRRGSRGGKKNKMSKDQRKALLKRKKAVRK